MMLPIAIMTVLKEIFHLNSPLGVIYKLKVSSHVKQSVYNFIKKETLAQVFSYEFAKFLRTPFFTEHLRWLFLSHVNTFCVWMIFYICCMISYIHLFLVQIRLF